MAALDPPRADLRASSTSPATQGSLARDGHDLVAQGYALREVQTAV